MRGLCLLQIKCGAISIEIIHQLNAGITKILAETTSLRRGFSKSSKDFNFLSSAARTLATCNIFHARSKSDKI
jgi:hypothetical protein